MLNIWRKLRGGRGSDKELRQKAKEASPLLVAFVTQATLDFYKEEDGRFWWGDDERMLMAVVLGDVLLQLHLLDRFAFRDLGEEGRAVFMDALLPAVRDVLTKRCQTEEEARQFDEDLRREYNEKQLDYAGYEKVMPKGRDDIAKDTLFWEFAKRRAADIGTTNPIRTLEINLHTMDVTIKLVALLKRAGCYW
ncbi:MAG: hypothetical protein ACYDA9_10785 [Terriglobia bacterium]